MQALRENIKKLVNKAVTADKSEDALRFSQAALNAANTKHAFVDHLP